MREDGKLDLCVRKNPMCRWGLTQRKVLKVMDESDGVLPFTDKAKPEAIMREFSMIKLLQAGRGQALKEGRVCITGQDD